MSNTLNEAAGNHTAAFFSIIKNKTKYRLFLLKNLPAAYFSGLQLVYATEEECAVTIPYKWFTKNPFRSTYFACLSMAAEMSTGILAMAQTYKSKPAVSMLVVGIEGKFHKKATGLTKFICTDGALIKEAVENTITLNQSTSFRAHSVGYNLQQEVVAEFWITWSFKSKN
jgi:hypothetical protein